MKKKVLAIMLTVLVTFAQTGILSACGGMGAGKKVEVDTTKTQLYIGNFDGGYGSRWLEVYKNAFEEAYKDVSFENGKTGVEIIIINDKIAYMSENLYNTISNSVIDMVFTEGFDYYKFKDADLLYDISDVVRETIDGEEKTIEDKLTEDQRKFYGSGDGHYYGLPHFQALRGFIYDIDLFNQKKLYIKSDGTIAGISTDTDLSSGPNGVSGDYDDGLPATMDEFNDWCDFVYSYKKVTPIIWTGTYANDYTYNVMQAAYTDVQGYEGSLFRHNFGSTDPVTTKIISSFDSNGNPVITEGTLSRSNYLDVQKTVGCYYAYKLLYNLVTNNYYYKMSLNSTETHDIAHYDYLRSRFDPNMQPIALMLEGTWWEEESNYIFESMQKEYAGAGRYERNFGLMPFPKATEDFIGKPTLYDGNQSIVIVNGNCSETKAALAKTFLKYISSDENLQLFNTITGVARDYVFSLTNEQYNGLSSMAKSIYDLRSDSVGTVYTSPLTRDNYYWQQRQGGSTINFNGTIARGESYGTMLSACLGGITPKEYFEGLDW